ncbi:hypothetical protein DL765_010279 [Monosporascus sp. GIB2]|nr:hypothetical protein DL765_010279 [Monosporascus sp. GIB2]
MSQHAPTSRPKPRPAGNEEAGDTINLGEFQDVETLTLSEAALVINALVTKRRNERKMNETEMLTKTVDYLDAFSRFKKKENVEAVERLLSAHKEFHKFERAQLVVSSGAGSSTTGLREDERDRTWGANADRKNSTGSLCCETAEEAKTLIPSLQDKISDEDLQDLLDEMYKLMPR